MLFLLPFCVTACAGGPPPLSTDGPHFSALTFFAGHTEGRGSLKTAFAKREAVHVTGLGRIARDGSLILDQTVTEGAKPPKQREWRIREVAPGRYAGTLSDATGQVAGETLDGRLRLRFTIKHGLAVEQWLALEPGGRAAENHMTVRKFGIVVASLDETIRKID